MGITAIREFCTEVCRSHELEDNELRLRESVLKATRTLILNEKWYFDNDLFGESRYPPSEETVSRILNEIRSRITIIEISTEELLTETDPVNLVCEILERLVKEGVIGEHFINPGNKAENLCVKIYEEVIAALYPE